MEGNLQPLRPAAGAVVHAHDLDRRAAHAIRDDVGGFGYDEFARSRHASRSPKFRILRKELLYGVEDVRGDALCGGRIMLGDVRAEGTEVVGLIVGYMATIITGGLYPCRINRSVAIFEQQSNAGEPRHAPHFVLRYSSHRFVGKMGAGGRGCLNGL
jgi:hypothetical protein